MANLKLLLLSKDVSEKMGEKEGMHTLLVNANEMVIEAIQFHN